MALKIEGHYMGLCKFDYGICEERGEGQIDRVSRGEKPVAIKRKEAVTNERTADILHPSGTMA